MALLIPGDCLSVPFSFPNASIQNSCLWVSLQTLCSRDEWTGLFSGTGWLTISAFLFSKSYSSLQPFISVYEGGSTNMREQGRDLRSPWDEEDIPHSSCFFPSWFKHHQLQYRKKKHTLITYCAISVLRLSHCLADCLTVREMKHSIRCRWLTD